LFTKLNFHFSCSFIKQLDSLLVNSILCHVFLSITFPTIVLMPYYYFIARSYGSLKAIISPLFCTCFIGTKNLKGQLLPFVEEKLARIRTFFISCVYSIHILNTLRLSYLGYDTPSNFCIDIDLSICTFCISSILDISQMEQNWKNYPQDKVVWISD